MQAARAIPAAVVTIVLASTALGTSFIVPSDEWLIEHADAIVTGTVVDARSVMGLRGLVETTYTIRVDERLKGIEEGVSKIEVTQLGGKAGDEVLRVSGSPKYEVRQRYLIFLRRAGDRWTTLDLLLGQFVFRTDPAGEVLLVREEHLDESGTGTAAVRPATDFVSKVREIVRHDGPDVRRLEAQQSEVTERGDLRLAAQVGTGSWSGDESSSIRYSVSSVPATGETPGDDGEDRVIAGDPQDLIPGTLGVDSAVIAVAIYGCRAGGCVTVDDPARGGRYAGIAWADVLLNDVSPELVLSQALLNTVLTHELGHTLGFRHSNRIKNDPDLSSSDYVCSEPLPCSTTAVMSAEAEETLNGALAEWDRDAANSIYGDGSRTSHDPTEYVDDVWVEAEADWVPAKRFSTDVAWMVTKSACQPLVITSQPRSTAIAAGEGVELSVEASGVEHEVTWYEGRRGDTTYPIGWGSTLTIRSLSKSTQFWALVAGPCATVESEVASVTVRESCASDELCTLSDRFHITLEATDQRTRQSGRGVPMPENDLFGSFSLPELTGNPENPEVFVKMLDGREINGEFWVFYGGLTDLDYVLSVRDVDTGDVRSYHKPAGSTAGGFDVGSGVTSESCSAEVSGFELPSQPSDACGDDVGELCLGRGRFTVVLAARDPRTGATGTGHAFTQTTLAGYFALPALTGDQDNPEVFVKVLDGRSVNGYFWVFFSGLTDLEYSMVVTDAVTGVRKAYVKPAGSACGAFDTDAF